MHRPQGVRFALLALLLALPSGADAGLRVVATLPELGALVREVGGDRVEVETLCRGYQDPHYLEAKPSYTRMMRKADLLVYAGLELEMSWLPLLLDAARNPRLRPGTPGLLEAGEAIPRILEVPSGSIDRSAGDIHPHGNPHFLLDPRNAVHVGRAVVARLAALDPEGASVYQQRLEAFSRELETRTRVWEARATSLKGKSVIAFHKQWEYLADWLGFTIADYIENRPGVPPAPRHVRTVIERIGREGIPLVLAATFVDVDAARTVAERGGARLVVLPASLGGVEEADSFFSWFDTIVKKLAGES